MNSEFVRQKVVVIQEKLPRIMSAVAHSIASNAGFPVEPANIRVMMRELTPAVESCCAQLVPHEPSDIVALLVREPGWLDVEDENNYEDEDENRMRPSTPLGMVGTVILAQMMRELEPSIKEVMQSQYGDVTFASIIEEIRSTLEEARKVAPVLADILDKNCTQQQEAKTLPVSRGLLPPMAKVRLALVDAGKMGDNSKLVAARTMIELMGLINDMGYQLDKTHVMQQVAAEGPRPR